MPSDHDPERHRGAQDSLPLLCPLQLCHGCVAAHKGGLDGHEVRGHHCFCRLPLLVHFGEPLVQTGVLVDQAISEAADGGMASFVCRLQLDQQLIDCLHLKLKQLDMRRNVCSATLRPLVL